MTFQNFQCLFELWYLLDYFYLDLQNTNLYMSNIFHLLNVSVWQRHSLSNPLEPHTPLPPNSIPGAHLNARVICKVHNNPSPLSSFIWLPPPSVFLISPITCHVEALSLSLSLPPFHILNQEDNPFCKQNLS